MSFTGWTASNMSKMIHPGSVWCAAIAAFALLTGCQPGQEISSEIQTALSGRSELDLATAVPRDWDRVCILGPYSHNAVASPTLGFQWDVESRSSIKSNDGVNLLLLVKNNQVVGSTEYERRFGDFSNLSANARPSVASRSARTAADLMNCPDGQEVRLGDKVSLGQDAAGVVVCSIDSDEYSGDDPKSQWAYLKRGVPIRFPMYGLIHFEARTRISS